nr:gluconeogenesis factor YvcK family protein [Thioalkalivibrio sp.]
MESFGRNGRDPKIVAIGGGTGTSTILQGLKEHTANLTAIVTMFDSGGSTGLLRRDYGLPPFGDLRQCLLALGGVNDGTRPIRDALEFRFGGESSLNGHSVGNLFMAALVSLSDDLESCIDQLSRILQVQGRVLPVTLGKADLCAELEDGRIIHGESHIDLRTAPLPRIKRIFLDNEVEPNPHAVQAIAEADAVVIGPGDLYTSILPVFLVKGMAEALSTSRATRIYVCNLMTKLGETDDFKASDFLRELECYTGGGHLDWAIVNTSVPGGTIQATYDEEGAQLVEADLDALGHCVNGIFASSFATDDLPLRHAPDVVGQAVLQIVRAGRVGRCHRTDRPARGNGHRPVPAKPGLPTVVKFAGQAVKDTAPTPRRQSSE